MASKNFDGCIAHDPQQPHQFQCPLVSGEEADEVCLEGAPAGVCAVLTDRAMGNGVFEGISDIVYVKPSTFDLARTAEIACEIGGINLEMVKKGLSYILIGFGRWGTANPRLGIPVTYAQVSHAKVIVEVSTPDLNVEPSQGTHFFHNIASCRVGYLSIGTDKDAGMIDWDWLESLPVEFETQFVRLAKAPAPIVTKIDGRTGRGMILKS